MRHANKKAFEQHLSSHLSRLYVVATSDEQMRKEMIDLILEKLPKEALIERFLGSVVNLGALLDALTSRNLLGTEPIVVLDEPDKKLLDALAPHCKSLNFGYLLIGVKSKVGIGFADVSGVICDLTEEKPWERDRRLLDSLHEMAKEQMRALESDAAAWMLEHVDRTALPQEMEKLLCYTEGKKSIRRSDVEAICCQSKISASWQLAEELVWDQRFRAEIQDVQDSSFFFALLAGVRQQLTLGVKMHSLLQGATPFDEWGPHFPKVFPKTLEKRAMACRKLGASYFRKGLDKLFDLELLAKSSSVPTDALIDYLRLYLQYALSTAKPAG